jgi:imidazolonepropionase
MKKLMLWRCKTLACGIPGQDVINDGAILTDVEKIIWVGTYSALPIQFKDQIKDTHHFAKQCITPGLIDCHTHVVYAGNRAHEWAARLQGESYESIAKQGGGIQFTVKQTQQCSEDELFELSAKRLQAMCESGVTTLEIKSGYGLNFETEAKMLTVAKRLEQAFPVTIQKTYLGLHTLPLEFKNDRVGYLKLVIEQILPKLMDLKLVDAVDAFCEDIAFTKNEVELFFQAAQQFNLKMKLHAEQLSDSEGVQLAARFGALSVDHIEFISRSGIAALAKSETVAVLLPVAYYHLHAQQKPPVAVLRDNKIMMAIATDCNPGSSPTTSLLLAMNMACMLFDLTPEETFLGVTKYAAQALGLEHQYGSLEPNKVADFVVWDIVHPIELAATLGVNPCQAVIKKGSIVYDKRSFRSFRS